MPTLPATPALPAWLCQPTEGACFEASREGTAEAAREAALSEASLEGTAEGARDAACSEAAASLEASREAVAEVG